MIWLVPRYLYQVILGHTFLVPLFSFLGESSWNFRWNLSHVFPHISSCLSRFILNKKDARIFFPKQVKCRSWWERRAMKYLPFGYECVTENMWLTPPSSCVPSREQDSHIKYKHITWITAKFIASVPIIIQLYYCHVASSLGKTSGP